jgi:hypothetical protein
VILLAANCLLLTWLKAVEVNNMPQHTAISLKQFMAIL